MDFLLHFWLQKLALDTGVLDKWEKAGEDTHYNIGLVFIQDYCLEALLFHFCFSEGVALKRKSRKEGIFSKLMSQN